jgi:hypothetical protein
MIRNYSDHTITIRIGNKIYIELPPNWSYEEFNDEPDFEEFLRKRYPELNPDYGQQTTQTIKEKAPKRKKGVSKK